MFSTAAVVVTDGLCFGFSNDDKQVVLPPLFVQWVDSMSPFDGGLCVWVKNGSLLILEVGGPSLTGGNLS